MHLLLAISKSSFTTMSVISLELTIEEKKQRTTKQEPTVVNDIGSICQGKRKKLYFKLKKIMQFALYYSTNDMLYKVKLSFMKL